MRCTTLDLNLTKFNRLLQFYHSNYFYNFTAIIGTMSSAIQEIDDSIFTLEYADSVPPLSRAAKDGDLDKIRQLLSKGSLPHTADNRGWTAIHCCAATNQVDALKLILKLKSKSKKFLVNLTTWENVTPLLIALKTPSPSYEMVRLLLKAGASPMLSTNTKLFPLHLACLKKGNLNLVKLLLKFGSDVNVQEDLCLFTPLHFAVSQANDIDIIRYLIDKSNLSLKNTYDRTAFLEACFLNFTEAVEVFIEKDKTIVNVASSVPPVVYAAAWGNLETIQLLIKSGADINCKCKAIISYESNSEMMLLDRENFLPIHSSLNNLQVFTLLLKLTESSKISDVDTDFCTFPLFVLLYAKSIKFFEALLQSNVPDELKTISCRVLINFILNSHEMGDVILEKFPVLFKYNFYFEPDNVFQNFVCTMSKDELSRSYKLLYILAQMGVSFVDEVSDKLVAVNCLKSYLNENKDPEGREVIRSTCDLLLQSVLSLKQLSRIVVRRCIRTIAKSDWTAYTVILESNLAESLKRFLFFDTFT